MQPNSVYVISVHHNVEEMHTGYRVYHLAETLTDQLSDCTRREKHQRSSEGFKKTSTANATWLNKRFNEQFNDCERAL